MAGSWALAWAPWAKATSMRGTQRCTVQTPSPSRTFTGSLSIPGPRACASTNPCTQVDVPTERAHWPSTSPAPQRGSRHGEGTGQPRS